MSPAFETYLARLYVDPESLRRFLADPRAAAAEAGLDAREVDALTRVDRTGLRLAAQSFASKRAARRPLRSTLGRLFGR
jgi:hypothetical protein